MAVPWTRRTSDEGLADGEAGVQGVVGILEHHGRVAAEFRQRLGVLAQLGALEGHPTGGDGNEAEDRAGERALAAAGFADDADALAGKDAQADVLHGAEMARLSAEEAAAGREAHVEIGHFEQRAHGLRRLARRRGFRGGGQGRMALDQGQGVGVLRRGEQRALRSLFDDPAVAHHRDPVAGLGDDAEIVADEDDGEAAFLAEFRQEAEDLALDRDVERGGGFVGDQDLRTAGEGDADHRPLAHAAGEFVRIRVVLARRVGEADLVEDFDGGRPGGASAEALVEAQALGDLVADAHDRVEMAGGILEDHADLAAANGEHLGGAGLDEIAAGEEDRAALDPEARRRQEADDGAAEQALAGAALADEAEDLAAREVEGDPVDQDARLVVEMRAHGQLANGEGRGHSSIPSRSARPSPSRLKLKASSTMARPGKSVIHQAVVMKAWPSATMTPHSASGGCTPRPR